MGLAAQASADHSQHWGHLSSIQLAGGIISVPLIAVGSDILLSSGLMDAIFSIVVGNLIIFLFSLCFVFMSFKKRLNAIENAGQFTGKLFSRALAFLVLVTMIGWLPRQLAPASQLLEAFPFFASLNIGALLGATASLVLLFGVKGLKNLCFFSILPLIVLFFLVVFTCEVNMSDIEIKFPSKFNLSGVSLIVSSLIASVVDFPTFFRHSRSAKDSVIALFVILFVTIIMQCSGLVLYKVFLVDKSFVLNILSKGEFAAIFLSMFLIVSIVTSASWNIYAASVGWESLFPQFKDKTEYAVIGLTATLLFTSMYMDNPMITVSDLIALTSVSDTLISGLGGVLIFGYLRHRFLQDKRLSSDIYFNNICWCIGGYIGLLIYFGTAISYYSTFAGLAAGFISIMMIVQLRKVYWRFVGR